jgi:hypothetical protein
MARTALLIALFGLAVTRLTGQAIDFSPGRYGSLAISDAEVEQITDLLNGFGKRPWLLHGASPVLSQASVYLAPDVAGSQILRGRMVVVVAGDQPRVPVRSAWRIRDSHAYVCVPAPGRQPGDIQSRYDLGWPFIVDGDFDDDTLISLVAFMRSGPEIPDVPKGRQPREVSVGPIRIVARQGDAILVTVEPSELTFQRVSLVRKAGRWVVTNFEWWIV